MTLAMSPQNDSARTGSSTNGLSNIPTIKVHGDRHDSKVSINTCTSTRSHQAYLDSLVPPSQEEIERISSVQEVKEEQMIQKRLSMDHPDLSDEEKQKAASLIQRNYRGYRARRQMQGLGLDPTSRWVEAVREARYRHLTTPKARSSLDGVGPETYTDGSRDHSDRDEQKRFAREKWKKIGFIARRAAGDEDSEVETEDDDDIPEHEREERRKRRAERTKQLQNDAKILDLQYFLEMVDLKHRYGSNLRVYHQEWQKASTHENFFYWLDEGEGRFIESKACSRERLDKERVRYLSREERLNYLVKIDREGRLCWAKNDARIDTTEKYKDSIHGIVPSTDPTPAYTAAEAEADHGTRDHEDDTSESSSDEHDDNEESVRAKKYATPELDRAPTMKKVKHVSAATIFNKLLRSSVKKNTWIFVADTSFRLYVGIKQSGAFQHSSFLHGSRIAAAGLIKIKDGKLDKLSPLSGHYRPNTSHFRAFVHSLKEAGADMHHVSISRSYAVLVGLEAYVKTRRRGKRLVKALVHGRDKLLTPNELTEREEAEMDKSESAARERRLLEIQHEEEDRDENKANIKLLRKLHLRPTTPKHGMKGGTNDSITEISEQEEDNIVVPGQGPENAIAPEGTRRT